MKQSEYNNICRAALMLFLRNTLNEMYEPGSAITGGYAPADVIEAINVLSGNDDMLERHPDLDFEV